jgi:hypothetical protein
MGNTLPTKNITTINEQEKIYSLVYKDEDCTFKYVGGMLEGYLHGKGRIEYKLRDELLYKIEDITFHYGIIRGQVTIEYSDDVIYTGFAYINSSYDVLRHGSGAYYNTSSEFLQIGIFDFDDFEHGLVCDVNYYGEWCNYQKHGVGIDISNENPNFNCCLYQKYNKEITIGSIRDKPIEELFGMKLPEEFVKRVNKLLRKFE